MAAVQRLEVVDGCRRACIIKSFDVHILRAAARVRTRLPESTQGPAAPIEELRGASHPSASGLLTAAASAGSVANGWPKIPKQPTRAELAGHPPASANQFTPLTQVRDATRLTSFAV